MWFTDEGTATDENSNGHLWLFHLCNHRVFICDEPGHLLMNQSICDEPGHLVMNQSTRPRYAAERSAAALAPSSEAATIASDSPHRR